MHILGKQGNETPKTREINATTSMTRLKGTEKNLVCLVTDTRSLFDVSSCEGGGTGADVDHGAQQPEGCNTLDLSVA